jgi:fused signal recognition particle receptor
VTRAWAELLGEAGGEEQLEDERAGFVRRLRSGLGRSREALTRALPRFGHLDGADWEQVEEALISADVGVSTSVELVERLRRRRDRDDVARALVEELAGVLRPPGTLTLTACPFVILVIGVNGAGKTTTIGKLAHHLREHGHDVVVAAADTFRAAAGEQLEIWAERAGADFVGSTHGGDPAAVAFDAIAAAEARGRDVVLVDTAGRLHTQTNLMEELRKVRRVIAGRLDGAPHATLLVLDATAGQNGLQQARLFHDAVEVTAVALTKLDSSAKGGIAVAVAHELGLPITLVGVGEGIDDLQPFDPDDFAAALVTG